MSGIETGAPFAPDWVSLPGDTIADVLAERGWSCAELARRMGCTEAHISQIINGEARITEETASGLARVIGGTAGFWLRKEAAYRARLSALSSSSTTSARERAMKADRYQPLRDAIAAGPTPGPWAAKSYAAPRADNGDIGIINGKGTLVAVAYSNTCTRDNAAHIAACDPDTIRALLAERDALRAAVKRVVEIADSDPFQTVGFTVEHVVDLRAALADGEGE